MSDLKRGESITANIRNFKYEPDYVPVLSNRKPSDAFPKYRKENENPPTWSNRFKKVKPMKRVETLLAPTGNIKNKTWDALTPGRSRF